MKLRLKKTLDGTTFKDAPMVAIAATASDLGGGKPANLEELIRTCANTVKEPKRVPEGPFLFEFDHCFQIKSQGTVLTGTILRGSVKTQQTIEIPSLKDQRKVKSMQMFHRPVTVATMGDRVGICVTQLDASLLERGVVCEPGSVSTISAAVVSANRVRFFKGPIKTKAQFHSKYFKLDLLVPNDHSYYGTLYNNGYRSIFCSTKAQEWCIQLFSR